MAKKKDHPVKISSDRRLQPKTLTWLGDRGKNQETVAEILDSWREIGTWWENEHERQVYLVITATQKSYELYQDLVTKEWHLTRIFD